MSPGDDGAASGPIPRAAARRSADAIVVGGGVIGSAVALALAERGAKVALFDAGAGATGASDRVVVRRGRAPASAAAAGILGAQMEAKDDGPLTRLCLESRARFAAYAEHVEARGGIRVEHRRCGVTVATFDEASLDALEAATAWQRARGLRMERLDAKGVLAVEPEVSPGATGGLHFPDDARVDPRALLEGLRRAGTAAGVVEEPVAVRGILQERGRVAGVETEAGRTAAACVILCAGSWSALVGGAGLGDADVVPVRGQMLELRAPAGLLTGVILGPDAYLSPRDDGRVLVGSTVERAGFDASVTATAARDLLAGALELVPALGAARLSDHWAGLRPCTADELPLIGPLGVDGLLLATGHFRNGVLLAPITADIVAALVDRRPTPVDIAAFSPARLASLG